MGISFGDLIGLDGKIGRGAGKNGGLNGSIDRKLDDIVDEEKLGGAAGDSFDLPAAAKTLAVGAAVGLTGIALAIWLAGRK